MELLNGIIIQVFYYVLLIVIAGFLIALLNKLFYKLLNYNRFAVYGTGLIGTPIHETSHALVALLFGHKVTEIKFFQVSDDGVLGYVNHSYNKKNLYHQLGNYFIGIAPILVGSFVLYLLTMLLLPTAYNSFDSSLQSFVSAQTGDISFKILEDVFVLGKDFVVSVFEARALSWQFIVYLVVTLCLSLHMNLSNADIKGSLKGLPFFLLLLALVNGIIYIIPLNIYRPFNKFMITGGAYLMGALVISLIFSIVLVLIALLIRLISMPFRKK